MSDADYGFTWGPLEVTRLATIRGSRFIRVTTEAGREIEVRVSETGRSLRVYRNGKELT